jgi:DNA invertase Pin-like site-specific DNA recombinase
MRIVGYTRVSSNSPEQLHALEQQKARLWAAGCTEVYWDIRSRSISDRDQFQYVLGLIEQKACDRAIFIRIDRMTDDLVVLEKAIQVCLDSGIPIIGLDDDIDFETVGGRLQARMLCSLSRAEVERLSERVKRGYEYLRANNLGIHPPFGYCRVEGRMELDEEPFVCLIDSQQELSRAQVARQIVDFFLAQQSLQATLRELNRTYGLRTFATRGGTKKKSRKQFGFSVVGLESWLNNPILRGHIAYGRGGHQQLRHQDSWDIRYNTHPDQAIMTEEEFAKVAEILTRNSSSRSWKPAKNPQLNPLSGLVYCDECQSYCQSIKHRTIPDDVFHRYYKCQTYRSGGCTQQKTVKGYGIEMMMVTALIQQAREIVNLAEVEPQQESLELINLKKELAYYRSAPGNRAKALIADLEHQIQSHLKRNNLTVPLIVERRKLLLKVFKDPDYWKTLNNVEKLDIYQALVDRVMIRDGEVVKVDLMV